MEIVTKSICDAREWQQSLLLVPETGVDPFHSNRQALTSLVPAGAICHVDAALGAILVPVVWEVCSRVTLL